MYEKQRISSTRIYWLTDFIAFDLGVYKLPSLLIDMGDYLNQDSDLITVARGKILSCWPGILMLIC
jgi:hypothetical protein